MVNGDYKRQLEHHRENIDSINEGLKKLLQQRMEEVLAIGRLKAENGIPVYDPEREEQIYRDLCVGTNLPEWYIRSVFKQIIEGAKKMESEQKATQGARE